ncbi:EAL domain-containing protein [Alcaligenaceae bacterium]|nr:EAL domain-containing protein [Alcaligenaceae bacterium]
MHKARYWLLLKIAKMPKVFTYGAGVLIALALGLVTMIATVWLDQNRVAQRHGDAIRIFQAISAESTALLDHLVSHDGLGCGQADLLHMNAHLLKSRYLREIGILNEDRGLICSTALGRVAEPIKGDYPVHVSRSGLQLLNNIPLTMAEKKLAAVIIQRPPFNVVLSPFATGDIYASADAVWLRTADGLTLLSPAVESVEIPGMRERAARLERPDFELRGMGYELVTTAPGLDVALQTQRGPGTIVRESGMLLPVLLAGSLLIAVLAVGTIAPYVLKLSGLRNRIGFLCDEAHLALVYQTVFDLTTMRPVGCEVLARLKEDGRPWMPDRMIPAIQAAGLEQRFDHAVTKKAIRELAAHLPVWNGKFSIAVNYFPESVKPDELIPVLTDALRAAGRRDLEICIEITEHSLSSELIAEVQCLKAQGFLIAVDDFGTGYSNLKSVTRLSPDRLKIDRSFVHELEGAPVRSSLIPEIVDIARAVNAQTVAEGIENMEQARLLTLAGVHYGQGYALARPMEIAQFTALIAKFK